MAWRECFAKDAGNGNSEKFQKNSKKCQKTY